MNDNVERGVPAGPEPVRIAVSSCLLGQAVRYDGGQKYYPWLVEVLGPQVQLHPVCPEVAIGMGIPRPSIQLVRHADGVHAVGLEAPGLDVSERLRTYAHVVADGLDDFCGYVFKRGSPSCGVEGVPVFAVDGRPVGEGTGLFAATVRERWPGLPMVEESGLDDPVMREDFLVRVFSCHRWREVCRRGLDPAALVDFHSRSKFLILAHDESRYRELGPLVAQAGAGDLAVLARDYEAGMMAALRHPATPGQHCNVLAHLLGLVKDQLPSEERRTIVKAIEDYRNGIVPLRAAQTALLPSLQGDPRAWRAAEWYLRPYPTELR